MQHCRFGRTVEHELPLSSHACSSAQLELIERLLHLHKSDTCHQRSMIVELAGTVVDKVHCAHHPQSPSGIAQCAEPSLPADLAATLC